MKISPGDEVAYASGWLNSVGLNDAKHRRLRGLVDEVTSFGDKPAAYVCWDNGSNFPTLCSNLRRVGASKDAESATAAWLAELDGQGQVHGARMTEVLIEREYRGNSSETARALVERLVRDGVVEHAFWSPSESKRAFLGLQGGSRGTQHPGDGSNSEVYFDAWVYRRCPESGAKEST